MKGVHSIDEEMITGFERIATSFLDKTAIIYLGEKFSYGELKELIYRFATALYELGIRDNDKVMIYLPNCPQWIIAFFGIQKIGAIPVPTSPIYTPFEVSYQLNDSGAETIICQDTNFGDVREVLPKTCLKRIIVTNLADFLPWWKRMIGWGFDRIPHGIVEKSKGIYFFKDLITKYPPKPPKVEVNPREHLAYILYTGGTTGFPKGVAATHTSMTSAVKDGYDIFEGYVSEGDDTYMMVTPLFHIVGIGMFLVLGLTIGNRTILMPRPLVDAILEGIRKYKATLFFGVPTLYRMILENERLDMYDLSSLKYCWSGGDVLPSEVLNRFKKLTNRPIYQAYGTTETGALSYSCLGEEVLDGVKLGKLLPTRKGKILDPETLAEVPTGKTGELIVTSSFFPMGYWNKPEETAQSFVELDGEKWYKTGDYVEMNENGELSYVERSADIIKCKGYRVSASEIEAVLQNHEAVIGACVVGVPDPKAGQRIKGIVVLKEDARGVGAADLVEWCRERLAPYKIPKYIEFRDMLPKSKVGKMLRREVRDEERRRAEKEQV
jgi:long-chain acyl-CoA synthetase